MGLRNAQPSLICNVQFSPELSSLENEEVQMVLGSYIIFLQSRIIALVFDDDKHLCRLAALVKAQGIPRFKPINHAS